MPEFHPNFTASGIGTLPLKDPAEAVGAVLSRITEMPYWPQLPVRSPLEGMNAQYAPALAPLLVLDEGSGEVRFNAELGREAALAELYERIFAGGDGFGLTSDTAAGFFAFMDAVAKAPAGAFPWLKGHVTGPLTLASSVLGEDGKALLYDEEVAEAMARALGAAAAAQYDQMSHLGRPVLLFFDEPFLSGFGSAFTPIARERVVELLGISVSEARERCDAVLGVHCCGNTDWAMLVESGLDVLNLDSAGFGEHLLLYPQALKGLYARGGAVAWGAVPTEEFKGHETAEQLWADLKGLLERVEALGVDRAVVAGQALITPACGMGARGVDQALTILDLTRRVSELARQEFA